MKIRLLWSWFVRITTDWLPDCAPCMRFRGWLYGLGMKQRGRDFQVASQVRLAHLEKFSVGDHVYLAPGVVVLACQDITLEDEVMIAHHTVLTDGNHTAWRKSYRFGPRSNAPVRVQRGSWVGANCTVVAGVRIGRCAVVGANSVVTSEVPDYGVVGGVPAKPIQVAQEEAPAPFSSIRSG
jgi:acetyltransferase-like isoleucine patch superfamily enzyme